MHKLSERMVYTEKLLLARSCKILVVEHSFWQESYKNLARMPSHSRIFQECHCIHVGRVSRGGQQCYCWELRGSRSFSERRSCCCPCPRKHAVVDSLAKCFWIKRSIISVSAEIWACEGSRLDFILSSNNSGENLMLFSLLPSIIPVSVSRVF